MDLVLKTPPSETSVGVELLKQSKRILHSDEDDLLNFWLKAADDYVERETNRALMEQTLVLRVERVLPIICLPRPPLIEVKGLEYTIDGGSRVQVDVSDLLVTKPDMLAQVEIPDVTEAGGFMVVEYEAGAQANENVPFALRQAALLLASHYVTSREAAYLDPRTMHVEKVIEFGVDQLCRQYRVPNMALLNGG